MYRPSFAAIALLIAGGPASAAFITFEGQFNTIYIDPIVRSGFEIGNPATQEQHFHEITSTDFGLPNNGTGVLLNDRDTEIFVRLAGGGAFTLSSVDVAASLSNSPAAGLTITGYMGDSATGSITIAALGSGYTAVDGDSLGVIDRLVFDGAGGGGGFVLDNLAVNEAQGNVVPAPAGALLFAMGFAGLGVARSLRRRTAPLA
jgi:hypothetical protein